MTEYAKTDKSRAYMLIYNGVGQEDICFDGVHVSDEAGLNKLVCSLRRALTQCSIAVSHETVTPRKMRTHIQPMPQSILRKEPQQVPA